MWFKAFVLLRLPVSVICILGYGFALGVWGGFDMAFLGGALGVGPYIFIAYTSIKLFRLRKSALQLAWWLLALETVGAALLGGAAGKISENQDYALLFAWGCVVIMLWVLPNALILYKARALFTEPAKEKPGL